MKFLLLALHNLLFPIALVFMAPSALKKMKARGGQSRDFWQRFGLFRSEQVTALRALSQPIWIHAVSVGEVGVAIKLARALRVVAPDQDLVMTTTTPTGYAILQEYAKASKPPVVVLYSAIDGWFTVRRYLRAIRPSQLVLLESELWPNLLHACSAYGAKITLVNARLSARSERRYQKVQRLAKAILAPIHRLFVPELEDQARWVGLGLAEDRVVHTGSLKYDPGSTTQPYEQIKAFRALLQNELGWDEAAPVLLAASTHAGEEALLAQVYQQVRNSGFPELKLMIVPRHVERRLDILAELHALGFDPVLRSKLDRRSEVLIVDSTGELLAWQFLASLVVVGKSFLGEGGQNPAEAVFARKPVLFGPNMQNFEPLVKLLLEAKGALQVEDATQLTQELLGLLQHPEQAEALASAGHQALAKHQGAVAKTVSLLLSKK